MKMLLLFALLLTLDACQSIASRLFRRSNPGHLQAFLPLKECLLLAQMRPVAMSALSPVLEHKRT